MGSAILAALGCILLLVTQTLLRLLTTQLRLKMKLLCLLLSALTISCAYGGVVREDDLVDMIQGVMADPDAYASAMGMVRNKRSAWDREFNLEKMGFNFRIKYQDPANRKKGGKAEIEFKDVRKFFRGIPAKSLKLVVNADSGAKFGDGLFDISVDYEVGFLFGGQDSGNFKINRQKEGDFYKLNLDFMSNSQNNPDRPPTAKLELKGDYKSRTDGKFHFNDFKKPAMDYSWFVDFDSNGLLKGEFKGEKTYTFEGQYDQANKKVDVVIDVAGQKYHGFADVDFDGTQGMFKINFDLGPAGKFDFEFKSKKDMSDASVKMFLNNKDIFSAKLKGKMDKAPKEFMQEVRWTGAFVGDGKMRVAYKRFHELKVQYLPKNGMTFELVFDREAATNSLNFRSTATYNNEKEFEVVSKVTPVNEAEIGYDAKMDWFMRDRNPFYRMFYQMNCLHCLRSFNLDSKLRMNKAKFSQHFLEEMAATFDLRTTRFNDFEVEGEWSKGKFLKVTTNREWFKNFKIENMDGYMRKVEFNGKELMKAGFEKAGKQIKQTVEMPDGTKVDTVLTWETDNYYKNKAKFSLKRDNGNFMDNEFEWDVQQDYSNMNIKDKTTGEHHEFGKFDVSRDYTYKHTGASEELRLKGKTNIPNSPFPENFETELEAVYKKYDDFNFGAYTYVAGEKMGIKFDAKHGMNWFL